MLLAVVLQGFPGGKNKGVYRGPEFPPHGMGSRAPSGFISTKRLPVSGAASAG
jgi:hypothetical protein